MSINILSKIGVKILLTGLTVMKAAPIFLRACGSNPDNVALAAIGAAIMVLGAIIMWLDK